MAVKTLIPTKKFTKVDNTDNRANLNGDVILDFGLDFDFDTTIYPESDGKPMADNTKQFRLITMIKEGLESQYIDDPDVFIAGDLLWYAIKGDNGNRKAPDAMVVFGRPKGDRGSYKQWLEDNIPPQVVFEIISPSNSKKEMKEKLDFYELNGVNECYYYDSYSGELKGWLLKTWQFVPIKRMQGWISPQLGIRFEMEGKDLVLYHPSGERFKTLYEMREERDKERERADRAEAKMKLYEEKLKTLGLL